MIASRARVPRWSRFTATVGEPARFRGGDRPGGGPPGSLDSPVSLDSPASLGFPDSPGPHPGFSLIEVLVVIAMIALLLSLLLPSLSRARAQARSTACVSNLGQICRAENLYEVTNGEWMPGSPWTTGRSFLDDAGVWNPARGHSRLAVEWMDFVTPLRCVLYGSNSVPRAAGKSNSAAQAARSAILKTLTEGLFHCPANPHTMSWGHGTAPGPELSAVSYMTMWTIMRAGPGTLKEVLDDRQAGYQLFPGLRTAAPDADDPEPDKAPYYVAQSDEWEVAVPGDYRPRRTALGPGQIKVFAADGTRFYDEPSGTITYTTDPRAAKGMVSATPPPTARYDKGREYNAGRRLSYRHGNNDRMNAGFFDGHVESLAVDYRSATEEGCGFRGKAVRPQWYYPSGSVVRNPAALHDPSIPPDTRLP